MARRRLVRGKPKNWIHDEPEEVWPVEGAPSLTVYEEEIEPEPLGVLDQNGNELYWHYTKDPIGFRREDGLEA